MRDMVLHRVAERRMETADTVSMRLSAVGEPLPAFAPGQFAMLYAFGIGEVPISISECRDDGDLVHTIRAVGAVTTALCEAEAGTVIGARGPFGIGWDLGPAIGGDLVIVAGGIGLAPLRPVVHHVITERQWYGRVTVVAGARTPTDLLYGTEVTSWRDEGVDVAVTVDHAEPGWDGEVGLVTEPLLRARTDPERTTALLCGPEIMMRVCAQRLVDRGVPAERIQVSLERNMRCGIGLCGHCQLGPMLVCRDGPVCDYARAGELLAVKEL